jgi:Ca2+:H+ antiporter
MGPEPDPENPDMEPLMGTPGSNGGYGSTGSPKPSDVRLSDGIHRYAYEKTKIILGSNYVNVLLVFVPLGIVAGAVGWPDTAIFVLNFMAIIPLAALLSFATEELSLKVGETIGGLMNATFGNAVELIVRGCWNPESQLS